jgi:hypothetical protein
MADRSLTHQHDDPTTCWICRNRIPFDMPPRLVDTCMSGDLVIFAGAGISTENRLTYPSTFYEEIVATLESDDSEPSFPDAMTAFCAKFGRARLLQLIKHRFDYIVAFPELRLSATRFHRELGTIYPIRDIITTNWDTLFEETTGAIPIVTPEDYAFWDLPERKVFKIHGSMNNLGTLVATKKDYEECYRRLRTGLIGSSLKHLLATKTPVFVGYSFRDSDFNRIYAYLRKEMREVLPRSFIVTLDRSFPANQYPEATVIHTDGSYFLAQLKKVLVERKLMFPDEFFDGLIDLLHEADKANSQMFERLPWKSNPAVMYAASYQDGLRHALQRILSLKNTGEYSSPHHFFHRVDSYELLRKGALRARVYWDVAYIEGYLNGNYCLVDQEFRDGVPLYFVFGSKKNLDTLDDFLAEHENAAQLHRTAFAKAKKDIEVYGESEAVFHTPFLDHGYASTADGRHGGAGRALEHHRP